MHERCEVRTRKDIHSRCGVRFFPFRFLFFHTVRVLLSSFSSPIDMPCSRAEDASLEGQMQDGASMGGSYGQRCLVRHFWLPRFSTYSPRLPYAKIEAL